MANISPTVSIIYFTQGGTTASLADTVSSGVSSTYSEAKVVRIEAQQFVEGRWKHDEILQQRSGADAIVFDAPTLMGSVAAPFKAFADATAGIWYARGLCGKLARGFTISASPSGDKLHSLQYFNILAAQHGMLWANWDAPPKQADGTNRLGSYLGLMAQNNLSHGSPAVLGTGDSLSAKKYGQYIGELTKRL